MESLYYGDKEIKKIMYGGEQVWPKEEVYTITVNWGGYSCWLEVPDAIGGGDYAGGANIQIKAIEGHASMFDYREKDGINIGGTSTMNIVVDGNATYTAVFKRNGEACPN